VALTNQNLLFRAILRTLEKGHPIADMILIPQTFCNPKMPGIIAEVEALS